MFDETIPPDQLKPSWLYSVRVRRRVEPPNGHSYDHEDYGQGVYVGGGVWWVLGRDANWNRFLEQKQDRSLGGPVRATEEVAKVSWENDEQLQEYLEDYYIGPRLERQAFVRFEPEPRWISPTVHDLCELMIAEQDFERLPILGDALQDAGCDHAELIAACQNETEPAYAKRLVGLLLGGAYAEAVRGLEALAEEWNFRWTDVLNCPNESDSGLIAQGVDLHGADELEGKDQLYWQWVGLLNHKEYGGREDFYWGCTC